jgi:hypothetical protein
MCYSLLAGGKTSLAVEPAVLEAASLLEELTTAAEATSATRARAATLNKEESILVKSVQAQLSTAWELRCR